ncbi:Copalyl diphosphate synthase, partial [Thalictrum thalictroides]
MAREGNRNKQKNYGTFTGNSIDHFQNTLSCICHKCILSEGVISQKVSDLNEEIKRGIHVVKERVQSVDDGNQSLSAYDTAWVALVKDVHGSDDAPLFPSSIDWLINNQLPDGSWGDRDYFCAYDRLSCTLACVVALKTWKVNPGGFEKGLSFLRQNVHRLHDEDPEHQISGFEVTFPTLVEMAQKLGLHVVPNSSVLQDLLAKRELKLK